MNEIDRWLYFDGPEPELVRPILDAIREPPPSTPEEKERMARRFFERLDAELARTGELPGAEFPREEPSRGEPSREESPAAAGSPTGRREGEHQAKGERPLSEVGVTARSPELDIRSPAAPPAEPLVPPRPIEAPAPPRAEARPAEDLKITAPALDIPPEVREQLGRLPFKPRAPEDEIMQTKQVPVYNWRQGKTEPLGDDSIAKARAALPFGGNMVGAGVVQFPPLSLEHYAWLRARLLVMPEQSAEILHRYHVMNEASRRALDDHWWGYFARSPEARATFERALADCAAWLRMPRR